MCFEVYECHLHMKVHLHHLHMNAHQLCLRMNVHTHHLHMKVHSHHKRFIFTHSLCSTLTCAQSSHPPIHTQVGRIFKHGQSTFSLRHFLLRFPPVLAHSVLQHVLGICGIYNRTPCSDVLGPHQHCVLCCDEYWGVDMGVQVVEGG